MPVALVQTCTLKSVREAYVRVHEASYDTDDNENLAVKLEFDRKQANLVFHYTKQLRKQGLLEKKIVESEPPRYHRRGGREVIVRVVTYTWKPRRG